MPVQEKDTTKGTHAPRNPAAPLAARAEKSAKGSAKLFLGVALLGITTGAAAWLVLQGTHVAGAPRSVPDGPAAPQYLLHLDGFTVNLNDPEETHFLRVTIDIGIDHLPPGSEKEKDSAGFPKARIRDAVLSVLTVCKADVLLTPQGKVQLKKDLVAVLNRNIPELGAREVYFTEFLVQR
jgi:flagellar basal body-associated protein FliL